VVKADARGRTVRGSRPCEYSQETREERGRTHEPTLRPIGLTGPQRLWHASSGGRHRHQWSAEFVLDPASPEEELAVRAYLATQFSPNYSLDYDPTHYPDYGPALRSDGPARWIAQLDRRGALAGADTEQRRPSEAISPASTTT
jgi:hypothetical protein